MTDLPERRTYDSAVARIEAKLDVAIAQHGAKLDEHTRQLADQTAGLGALGQRVAGVEVDLAVISAKVGVDGAIEKAQATQSETLKNMDARLSAAEKKLWSAVGASAGLAAIGSYLIPQILGG